MRYSSLKLLLAEFLEICGRHTCNVLMQSEDQDWHNYVCLPKGSGMSSQSIVNSRWDDERYLVKKWCAPPTSSIMQWMRCTSHHHVTAKVPPSFRPHQLTGFPCLCTCVAGCSVVLRTARSARCCHMTGMLWRHLSVKREVPPDSDDS